MTLTAADLHDAALRHMSVTGPVRFNDATVAAFLVVADDLGFTWTVGDVVTLDDDQLVEIEKRLAGRGSQKGDCLRFRAGVTVPHLVAAAGAIGYRITAA